jgi:hypothetical protein
MAFSMLSGNFLFGSMKLFKIYIWQDCLFFQ